ARVGARTATARAVQGAPYGHRTAHGLGRPGSLHPRLQAGLPHHPGRAGESVAVLSLVAPGPSLVSRQRADTTAATFNSAPSFRSRQSGGTDAPSDGGDCGLQP